MAMSIMLPVSPASAVQETTKQVVKVVKQEKKKIVKKKKKEIKIKKRASRSTMRSVARRYAIVTMKKKYNWSLKQFGCLDHIWENESHWQFDAKNRRSGALGIPQAYPGKKMKSAGRDYKTNYKTQIKWGLNYIKKRYGTPCQAHHFRKRHGYY
jgi:hypothetical protein